MSVLERIAVIGAGGQLGSALVTALAGLEVLALERAALDIERPDSVAGMLRGYRPTLVINTAAFHNVEQCQQQPERAFAVNAIAIDALAAACAAADAAFAHVSTDYVFDGSARAPYDEGAPPRPLNVYGVSKYAGELALGARLPAAFVFRTSGLYGTSGRSGKGPTFVERMRSGARAGTPLRVVDDIRQTPSYAPHVAAAIRAILATGTFGTYHVTNSGECSWYEFALEILRQSHLEARIERTTSEVAGGAAHRPKYSVLAHRGMQRLGLPPMPDWRAGLRAYLSA